MNDNQVKQHGGARAGAGRKLHSKNPATIEKEEALRQFRERVAKSADRLFNSQMALAEGLQILFRVDKDSKGRDLPAIQVTDPAEIKRYIDGETDESYYFISTKQPDNRAIDSLMDRTFGKSQQSLDVTTAGEKLNVEPDAKLAADFETFMKNKQ